MIAVSNAEIIAVEIKSERDKLDRLPDQIKAMQGAAHHVIAALHEKHLITNAQVYSDVKRFGAGGCRPEVAHLLNEPPQARGAVVWAYPEAGAERNRTYGCARWEEPRPAVMNPGPRGALDMLWAAELYRFCADAGVPQRRGATRPQMMNLIRWRCSGEAIIKGVCVALRRRICIEADPVAETVST